MNVFLWQKSGVVDIKEIVPAQHFLRAIEKFGIAATRSLE
jgi:hypothetical protein